MDQRLSDLSHLARRPLEAWRAAGWWGQNPLWEKVRDSSLTTPDRVAVIDDTGQLTAQELWSNATSIAAALRNDGVAHGDIVLVQTPNWREFASLVVAIEATAAVLGFCPTTWGPRETARALDLLRPAVWFVSGHEDQQQRQLWVNDCLALATFRPKRIVGVRFSAAAIPNLDEWKRTAQASDAPLIGGRSLAPLEIAVTSGTTGDPKGVLHVHDSALATVGSTIDRQRITRNDVIHVAIPVGHTFGYFYGVRCALQSGATLLLQERWSATRAATLIEKWTATVSLGPAACIVDLLSLPSADIKKLSSLRLFTQSGDALPRPVAERAANTFTFRISRALGMTEFGHALSTDADTPLERIFDSSGSPQPGVSVEIRDADGRRLPNGEQGKVFIAGPCLFAGYLKPDRLDPDILDSSGFFDTGDLGWLGDDGYLHVTGREKNVIRRGAVTIPTTAVEDAIASHRAINHAVVVALPDERLGERPVVCIQPHQDQPAPSLDELHAHLDGLKMTEIFWPSDLLVVHDWPLGPTGKIDRTALIERFKSKSFKSKT